MTDIDAAHPLSHPVSLLDAEQRRVLEALLQPVREDLPCGPPISFDPIHTEIRLAREEDDPDLPMGVWRRPAKRADWPHVAARCKVTLGSYSKDLQIAAWLAEAWTRQHGVAGLLPGLLVIDGLLRRFWETVHPQVDEDGDAVLRVTPLEWLNASMAATLRMRIPLLDGASGQDGRFRLLEWERMTTSEPAPAQQRGDAAPTRAAFLDHASAIPGAAVARNLELVRACVAVVGSVAGITRARLGGDAPSMSKLDGTLRAMEQALLQLAAARGETPPFHPVEPAEAPQVAAAPPHAPASDGAPSEEIPQPRPHEEPAPQEEQALARRIAAICEAAGIHEPTGAERLMAMKIGLLHDQNLILQYAHRAGDAGADFTALVGAAMQGRQ